VTKTPNPIDQHVGKRVRMRRTMLGFSQEKLGGALGLTFQQVQKYEKGTNRIGASRLQAISKILDVPPSFFFDGAPTVGDEATSGFRDAKTTPYVPDFVTTAEGLQLNRAFARIRDPKVRKRIVELVAVLSESEGHQSPDSNRELVV
jgi:transcriptional regulator with XRE-family HTH domain